MNSFLCLACVHSFGFTWWTVFISAHEFSCFYLSNYFLHPTWLKWGCGCLGAELPAGLNHNNMQVWLLNNRHKNYHFHYMISNSWLLLSFTLRLILTAICIWAGGMGHITWRPYLLGIYLSYDYSVHLLVLSPLLTTPQTVHTFCLNHAQLSEKKNSNYPLAPPTAQPSVRESSQAIHPLPSAK